MFNCGQIYKQTELSTYQPIMQNKFIAEVTLNGKVVIPHYFIESIYYQLNPIDPLCSNSKKSTLVLNVIKSKEYNILKVLKPGFYKIKYNEFDKYGDKVLNWQFTTLNFTISGGMNWKGNNYSTATLSCQIHLVQEKK